MVLHLCVCIPGKKNTIKMCPLKNVVLCLHVFWQNLGTGHTHICKAVEGRRSMYSVMCRNTSSHSGVMEELIANQTERYLSMIYINCIRGGG